MFHNSNPKYRTSYRGFVSSFVHEEQPRWSMALELITFWLWRCSLKSILKSWFLSLFEIAGYCVVAYKCVFFYKTTYSLFYGLGLVLSCFSTVFGLGHNSLSEFPKPDQLLLQLQNQLYYMALSKYNLDGHFFHSSNFCTRVFLSSGSRASTNVQSSLPMSPTRPIRVDLSTWPHTWPPWYPAVLTCSSLEALTG